MKINCPKSDKVYLERIRKLENKCHLCPPHGGCNASKQQRNKNKKKNRIKK
jgi:hypothetical protein